MTSWSGKSRGGKAGYLFFILLLKYTGRRLVYLFVRFVALYFWVVSDKKAISFYFRRVHNYSLPKTIFSIYQNYYFLGQMLIDKISVLSGKGKGFTYNFDDKKNIYEIIRGNKGGLLIGAHVGNWDIAGQMLNEFDVRINIVVYEAEHRKIKELLENYNVSIDANIIPIKDDYSHLYKIKDAFARKELVVMHGDRFLPGANTITMTFMNKKAKFPSGPLYLASKNNVPVSFVYAMKETPDHYHLFASKPKMYSYPARIKTRKRELENMLQDYISSLEQILKKYPFQWFNYYSFWEEELNRGKQ